MRFDPRVYLVTDRPLCLGRDLVEVVLEAVAGGATVVQLREKASGGREFVELARQLRERLDRRGVPLIINDRIDVALAIGAAGVHVGQSDIHPADARELLGPEAILGLSVKSVEHARQAAGMPLDYLGVGPIHPTSTKEDAGEALREEGLASVRGVTSLPLVAIGGLGRLNAAGAVEAGADGVAVVSAICSAQSPRRAAAELLAEVDAAVARREGGG
ncbi:thiamine phosphate synthase [Desulfohalovibrio reitneri]|uniref:thiamine phosphate synthase n=1 Tax=Desulfohalovibrio reitneri TaxID=1307759 RepID=UPI00054E7D59|nr:thiamine phosphate synthase [Desulfohalovibrio reitneri]